MEEILKSLAAQGPLVAMAGLVIWWLIQERKDLTQKLDEQTKANQEAQEECADEMLAERQRRLDEQKEATNKLEAANQALKESNRALRDTALALRSLQPLGQRGTNSEND